MSTKKIPGTSLAAMAIFLFTAFGGNAQKLSDKNVPQNVKNSQEKKYPGVKVKWSKEEKDFEAEFEQSGKKMSAIYDEKGTWKETETMIKNEELPAAVRDYMTKVAKVKSFKEAARINKADGSINYEAEANGKDYVFDANGKFLKEEKDED